MRYCTIIACIAGLAACAPQPSADNTLSRMPRNGALRPGQVVFVDDGTCPAGQIKQVVGGSNRIYQTDVTKPGAPRETSCVAR